MALLPQPASCEILPATWRDLSALRHLEKVCFPVDAWTILDLIGVLSFPNVVRLKALVEGEFVGFVAGDRRPSRNLAWIATIAVLPEYRQRGIATALMQACEDQLDVPCIRLSVRRGNRVALRLYEHLGYQQIGLWPAYYQDGTDAIVMEKRVPVRADSGNS